MFEIADQVVCVGEMTMPIDFSGYNAPTGTTYYWTVEGDEIGLPLTGGAGNIPSFVITGAGTVTVEVTPDYTNASAQCEGTSIFFTITSYERPIMFPIADITLCAGTPIEVPAFESDVEDATFTWRYVSGDNVGCMLDDDDLCEFTLPLTGNGDFPEGYIAVNYGITPAVATYAVKANGGAHCDGQEIFFTITVAPAPHVDWVENKAYCANTPVSEYTFSGTVPETTYVWTFIGGDNIGLVGSGTGSMPPFTTINNNTDKVLTAHYHVTATYNLNGVICGGQVQEFSISVLPNATITNLVSGVYCHLDFVDEMPFAGVATSWKWMQIAGENVGIEPNSGEGISFPFFQVKNFGNTPIAATFKVVPYYEVEGISCSGVEGYFTIMVNPQPYLNTVPGDMTYCHGAQVAPYTFSGTYNAVYRWTQEGSIQGIPSSGIGPIPGFVAYNYGNDMITAKFTVWAEYNNYDGTICKSEEQSFNINILPNADG
jgi:hypothetical protein